MAVALRLGNFFLFDCTHILEKSAKCFQNPQHVAKNLLDIISQLENKWCTAARVDHNITTKKNSLFPTVLDLSSHWDLKGLSMNYVDRKSCHHINTVLHGVGGIFWSKAEMAPATFFLINPNCPAT